MGGKGDWFIEKKSQPINKALRLRSLQLHGESDRQGRSRDRFFQLSFKFRHNLASFLWIEKLIEWKRFCSSEVNLIPLTPRPNQRKFWLCPVRLEKCMDTHVLKRLCYKSRVQQQSYASDASYYNTGLSLGCVTPFWLKGSIIKELPLICFLLLSLFGYCFTVHSSHSHWQSVLSQSMKTVCQRPSVMNNQLPSARKHLTS